MLPNLPIFHLPNFLSTLLLAAWTSAGAPAPDTSKAVQPAGGGPGFTEMDPSSTGVLFTNELRGDLYLTNAVVHNGAGLALGDVDGDGWVDVYFCNLQGPNRLYRNLGNWKFEPVDIGPAACQDDHSTGATFADVDGDADLDLLVNGIGTGTRLFLNDGSGRWTETPSGLSAKASATSLALADIDGDGDLDLYCAHYIDTMHLADPTTRFALVRRGEKWEVARINGESTRLPKWTNRFEATLDGKVRELPEYDGFYRNDGKGRFTPMLFEPGLFWNASGQPLPPPRDWGLSVMFRDMNGDRAPDLYICNDMPSPDRIWLNRGDGTFRELPPFHLRHTSRSSMGIDFADVDRDGQDDFFVVDMLAREHAKRLTQLVRDMPDPQLKEEILEEPSYNRNTLFFSRRDGSYAEAAFMAGVAASDWSWCPVFLDVDLDGHEDLLISNGFAFDVMDQDSNDQIRTNRLTQHQLKRSRQFHPRWETENAAFRYAGNRTFQPAGREWGFHKLGISYGMALGDLDNDGDLDVAVNNLNTTASLYRNNSPAPRLAVRLKGRPPNTAGIGAKITVLSDALRQTQEMICGGRYLAGDQAMRVFAAPEGAAQRRIEVIWRSGARSLVTNAQPNHIYEIRELANEDSKIENSKSSIFESFFKERSDLFPRGVFPKHNEAPYDDWARQPLLPWRLSRLGPGVGVFDLDGDGWEDLFFGAGKGGNAGIFRNKQGAGFEPWPLAGLTGLQPVSGDTTSILAWQHTNGERRLLVGISNFELAANHPSVVLSLRVHPTPALLQSFHPFKHTPSNPALGPMALGDVDGDGDLDLFAGGRFQPGKYPAPVSSAFWLNENGEFKFSEAMSQPLQQIGMVSAATFCDLDADGDADLTLALEWGPLRLIRNEGAGQFKLWNPPVVSAGGPERALNHFSGLWTGLTAGDFDGDGRLDLAAANAGRNTQYELYRPGPIRLYYPDINQDGTFEIVESFRNAEARAEWQAIRSRAWLENGWPELKQFIPSHAAYSKTTLRQLLGPYFSETNFVEAAEFQSGVFLNRGEQFEWRPLPLEAQMAPAWSIQAADLDGDGSEDLFLTQNFYGTVSDMTRDDSGLALWLRGRGDGTFLAVDPALSGLKIEGEQRGAAVADFNQDGRVDLAVAQNSHALKVLFNQEAKPALRVSLRGPKSNPDAVGTRMRVVGESDRPGPSRWVQAGSGYWSQNSAVQVLGVGEAPLALWVRWPGGQEQRVKLEQGTLNVTLDFNDSQK